LKIIVLSWLKVILQILLNHFFRHTAYRGAEIASYPEDILLPTQSDTLFEKLYGFRACNLPASVQKAYYRS